MALNVHDPIQTHLLVETALEDSKGYEILSPEEVDELKRQCHFLTQRIVQTKQNLQIQLKYREAASSMAKLYSSGDKSGTDKKPRRSLIGNRNSDSFKEVDLERLASEKKCDELAQELSGLEMKLMEPQRRLLQHTARVLQMTHKGSLKAPKANVMGQGIPGSPESMNINVNGRSSMERNVDDDVFDDRSLYRTADRIDGLGLGGRESYDGRASRSPGRLNQQSAELAKSKEQIAEQMQMISKTERKLEDLNARLREVIVKANPQRDNSYSKPPRVAQNNSNPEPSALLAQLQYLDQSITAVDDEQQRTLRRQRDFDITLEEEIEELNCELRNVLIPFDSTRPAPPQVTGKNLKSQLSYLQSSIGAIEGELQNASGLKSELDRVKSEQAKNVAAQQDNLEQVETVLIGLWDIIQSGEEDIRRRKLQRRQMREKDGVVEEESDLSGEDILKGGPETFSIPGFSKKVQWLFSQATSLKDQKKVLKRQIKQQRELSAKSDETKDTKLAELQSSLERTQAELETAQSEAQDLQTQLQNVFKRLDEARRDSTQRSLEKAKRDDAESAVLKAVQAKLLQRNDEIERLEDELQHLKDSHKLASSENESRVADYEGRIAGLNAEVEAARTTKETLEAREADMEKLNMEIARLQTEVTIARAELDGAYGSRAQRAAEVAANPAVQKEIDDLTTRNRALATQVETLRHSLSSDSKLDELKHELSDTLEEYEAMTKASIEWERDREALEAEIDRLRDDREALEASLTDERVRWLGIKSPGGEGGGGVGNTSTLVLKTEFKKMMRDMRAENVKALKVSFLLCSLPSYDIHLLTKFNSAGRTSRA